MPDSPSSARHPSYYHCRVALNASRTTKAPHEQQRLPDAPGSPGCAQILPHDALEDTDVEHLRDVEGACDLVGAWAARGDVAVVAPPQ